MNQIRRRSPASAPAAPARAVAVIVPGSGEGEWELCRPLAADTAPDALARGTRQAFPTLAALADNLDEAEPVVLTLPLEMGLVQRLALPPAEPDELREMANIQLEKILPYPLETVGVATREVSRTESEVILAVQTIPHDRLLALCQPLIARGCYPVHTMFYADAAARATPFGENAALLYRAAGRHVLGVCENGKLSFAQALGGQTPEELAAELPAVLLGAELEGVPTNFAVLLLDERSAEARDVLHAALGVPVETVDVESAAAAAGAAAVGGPSDLSPAGWRAAKVRGERLASVRQRIVLGVWIYLGLLVLGFAVLGVMRLRLGWQRGRLAKLQPLAEQSREAEARWRTLAPAVDPSRSVVETIFQVYQCLPTDNSVLLTAFDQTPGKVEIQGEAPAPSNADDFIVKLKARPELRAYHFEADPNSILPNGHARFHVTGTLSSSGAGG